MKAVIIAGAGSTLSDAAHRRIAIRPPLDRGFFAHAKKAKTPGVDLVCDYMKDEFGSDPLAPENDSLEAVMGAIYCDIFNPAGPRGRAAAAFRDLLRLINHRIAQTTNAIAPSKKGNIYRITRSLLGRGLAPDDITIITFNYDLHIEKMLSALNGVASLKKHGAIFQFPTCYGLSRNLTSSPPKSVGQFPVNVAKHQGVRLLKLHGSLNWYSRHIAKDPKPAHLLNPKRGLYITPRRDVRVDMTISGKRKMYTFPLVVPPVTHKAGIMHQMLTPVWKQALAALRSAHEVLAFGYSCPRTDQESASLISRGLRKSTNLKALSVIDPSPLTFNRFVELSGYDSLSYFKSPRAFLCRSTS